MNIYAIRNASATGKAPEDKTVGGHHSAGIVVVAKSKPEAVAMLQQHYLNEKWVSTDIDPDLLDRVDGPGVIIHCDGEC
jgi:hypothetical protein